MKKVQLLLLIIIVIIVLVAVAIVLFLTKKKEGRETAIPPLFISEEIYGFSGVIKEVGEKVLMLEASIPARSDDQETIKVNVKIAISDQTKLTKMKLPVEPEEKDQPVIPEETTFNFSELKVGDRVNVAFGENIADKLKAGEQLIPKNLFIIEE